MRSKRSCALLPHSRFGAQRCDRAGAGCPFAGGVQLRHGRRRFGLGKSDRRTSSPRPRRLEARGKGILLLHDIHHVTVAALPELLKKLKEDGFHVVHVVPGTGEQAEIASTAPSREANDTNHPSSVTPPNADQANVASAPQSSEQSDPGRPVSVPPPGAQQFAVASDPPLPERNNSDRPTPNTAPSADQAASVTDPAPSERNDADRQMPGTAPSADPTQAASEPSRDPDDPNWPKAEVRLASRERVELPAPDEEAFGTHYHPWRTVILADGSETAAHFALDAVPQSSRPTARRGGRLR